MSLTLKNLKPALLALFIALGIAVQCGAARASSETIVVAGGCFWCVEHDFEKVRGVKNAVSGFAGGKVANPSYKQVTRGKTGHYEAVQITFDPKVISRRQLLDMFFRSIDPTDAGGQFCDRGPAYRTAIFATPGQATDAQASKNAAGKALGKKIVTPILPAAPFYPAEAYHQDYSRSSEKILTRFGRKTKAEAYKLYRKSCGRDARVRELWGSKAPFVGG